MTIIKETEQLKLYWLNLDKNILMIEVLNDLTWEEVHIEVKNINNILAKADNGQPIYSIADMTRIPHFMPQGNNSIWNLYQLMKIDPGYEDLVIFVVSINLLGPLMKLGMSFYGFLPIQQKYRFVKTLDEALSLIEEHQSAVLTP